MAFLELSWTVQANNYHHQTITEQYSAKSRQGSEFAEHSEQLETEIVTGTVPPITEKRLLSVTVPQYRRNELKGI